MTNYSENERTELVKNKQHKSCKISKNLINEGLFNGNVIGYDNKNDAYILKDNLKDPVDKHILSNAAHAAEGAFSIAYGDSIYNSHLYILNQYEETKKQGKPIVMRFNSDDICGLVKNPPAIPYEMNSYVAVNPLKIKELRKGSYNALVEKGAETKTYTVRTNGKKGQSLSNIKFCESMRFSNRNIVIRITLYSKQNAKLDFTPSLKEEFQQYIIKMITGGQLIEPNIINFYETDCELWYCTTENSRSLDWLYDKIKESLTGKLYFTISGQRFKSNSHGRLKATSPELAHIFGAVTNDLTISQPIILNKKRYDIDQLATLCKIDKFTEIEHVILPDESVEKVNVKNKKSVQNWNRFLYERENMLKKIQSYESSLFTKISYDDLFAFHSNLCHLYFSTAEALYGVDEAVKATINYCKTSIIPFNATWLMNSVITPALNLSTKHYKYKTDKFVKKMGIPDADVEEKVLSELSYSISPAARAKRCREKKKELRKKAEEQRMNRIYSMFLRTADLEYVADTFHIESAVLRTQLLEYDKTGMVKRILRRNVLVLKRKIYNEYKKQLIKNYVKYLYTGDAALYDDIAYKYSVTVQFVENIINELDAMQDSLYVDYKNSLKESNTNDFAHLKNNAVILPLKLAGTIKKYAYHLTRKAVNEILGLLKRTNKYKNKLVYIQMMLAPHLRINFNVENCFA